MYKEVRRTLKKNSPCLDSSYTIPKSCPYLCEPITKPHVLFG